MGVTGKVASGHRVTLSQDYVLIDTHTNPSIARQQTRRFSSRVVRQGMTLSLSATLMF